VPLAKTFDSFDATLRLAAMTDQTDDFRDYITATQKMRAYRGKIEASSPLGQQAAAEATKAAAPAEEARPAPTPPRRQAPIQVPERVTADGGGTATNLIAIGAIVALTIAAAALVVALLIK
jgi:nucleoid-associated protein YgaU